MDVTDAISKIKEIIVSTIEESEYDWLPFRNTDDYMGSKCYSKNYVNFGLSIEENYNTQKIGFIDETMIKDFINDFINEISREEKSYEKIAFKVLIQFDLRSLEIFAF